MYVGIVMGVVNVMCVCGFFFSSRRRHTRCSRDWSSDVCSSDLEENFHPAGKLILTLNFGEALLGVRENGNDLFRSNSRKPFQELINSGSSFEILEERPNRYAGSPKNPCAAYLIFGSFDFRAIRPIQHATHDMLQFRIWARSLQHQGRSLGPSDAYSDGTNH